VNQVEPTGEPFYRVVGRRIVATEVEHAVHDPSGQVDCKELTRRISDLGARYGSARTTYAWMLNGGYAYLEVHGLAESATPELRNGQDVRDHEIGGTLYWALLAYLSDRKFERALNMRFRDKPKTRIVKANTGQNAASSGGRHINLSMAKMSDLANSRAAFQEDFDAAVRYLLPWVATSQIFNGTGAPVPEYSNSYGLNDTLLSLDGVRFVVSGRGYHVDKDWAEIANSSGENGCKPVFLRRNEPLADDTWRLQICGLDSPILPALMPMTIDLLILLADMMEDGALELIEIEREEGAPHTMRQISLNWRSSIHFTDGRVMTAPQVQWFYYRQAVKYVEQRGGQGRELLEQWAQVLGHFDTTEAVPLGLVGQVDWVTKYEMMRRRAKRLGRPLTYAEAEQLHLEYHSFRLMPNGRLCLPLRLMAAYGPPGQIATAWPALRTPPTDTRAFARAAFIRRYGHHLDAEARWINVGAFGGSHFKMPIATEPNPPGFAEFMERFAGDLRIP